MTPQKTYFKSFTDYLNILMSGIPKLASIARYHIAMREILQNITISSVRERKYSSHNFSLHYEDKNKENQERSVKHKQLVKSR